MVKDIKRDQPLELIIQRKGKTVFARLREDKEFAPAEVAGAAAFTARFTTLGQIRKELQDLLEAGGFRVVVPVTSVLAPEQAKVVVFGDMTGAAPVRAVPAPSAKPAAAPPKPVAPPAPKPAPPAIPAPRPAAAARKPAPVRASAPPPAPPAAPPLAPPAPVAAPALTATPKPFAPAPSRKPRTGSNLEDKAFKAFYDEWRAKNKIPRLPSHELEELRQGEWQEVKERFMAAWRK